MECEDILEERTGTARVVRVVAGAAGCRGAVEAGAVAIMVDALRASATLTAMLSRGVARVLVATHVEQARALTAGLAGALLVGERDCVPPPGFAAGNSPVEILERDLAGHTVVFTSTTGAARLGALRGAREVLVGSPVNLTAVVEAALAVPGSAPIHVVAAGHVEREGGVEEDWLGAALIADRLARRGATWENRTEGLGRHWPEVLDAPAVLAGFLAAHHGRTLVEKGFEADVRACARLDWLSVVGRVVAHHSRDDGPPVAEVGLR